MRKKEVRTMMNDQSCKCTACAENGCTCEKNGCSCEGKCPCGPACVCSKAKHDKKHAHKH